ncbi:hypothetical protein [Nocardia sp. NPDC052566]|uniref:hypothetical protein n=1 Tax=Nocardia sp. NPDC052566 TaxID=3364330 RepID=UPI0037C677F6
MIDKDSRLTEWERQRRESLSGLRSALDADHIDLDSDPLAFMATLDEFIAGQDFEHMDDDDWLWLHTMLAAYVAQVFLVEHHAKWDLITDERGSNYILIVRGRDGADHFVSPMDIVYDDFGRAMPPEIPRILAAAELAAGIGSELWEM